MLILGIETSCDETAASVVRGEGDDVEVLSNIVSSQIEIHKKYGGVVPEVAAREHVLNILPVVNEALEKAGIGVIPKTDFGCPKAGFGSGIDAIAVTVGPGLITSLIVGVETARVLSYIWNIPVIGINHIEGHIYANFISGELADISWRQSPFQETLPGQKVAEQFSISKPARPSEQSEQMYDRGSEQQSPFQETLPGQNIKFPAIILTVSGGHTMIVLMNGHGKYKVIGETRDDAAGEAFDKAAKLLGIGYPGGPAVASYAEKYKGGRVLCGETLPGQKGGGAIYGKTLPGQKSDRVLCGETLPKQSIKAAESSAERLCRNRKLPRPMIYSKDFDFSFSGLKTALLYEIRKDKDYKQRIPEYCYEFQQAAIDVLIYKTIKAALKYSARTVMLAGGVSANKELRRQMEEAVMEKMPDTQLLIPDLKYTTDNAAMVAAASYYHALRKDFMPWQKLRVDANLELK